MKAVLTTKIDPAYDDLPEERYHFPRTYLRAVEQAVGDWVVYYEPRRSSSDLSSRGGRQAYFATARIDRIDRDPAREAHFSAHVSSYLEFDNAVPFRDGELFYEGGLRRGDGETNKGAFGRSVRLLSQQEYDLIIRAGFSTRLLEIAEPEAPRNPTSFPGFADEQATFERPIVEKLVARPFREAAFAVGVKAAYANTCAITGLRIINGGGRAEVQAAHIRPVAAGGSDSIRNGLALSSTFHWMFDRGLISLDDDLSVLVARNRLPETVVALIRPDRKLIPPTRVELQPHSSHVRFHRMNVFKG